MTNKYLEKIAKDQAQKLKPHQESGVDALFENKGQIWDHSTGSGKTRTLLEAVKRLQARDRDGMQLVITPASLTTNIDKETKKHNLGINKKRMETISYEKAINDIDRLRRIKYSLIAMDEGHKMRNIDTKRFKRLEDLISGAEHRLIMTATPMYNSPENIAPLINLVANDSKLLPTDKRKFEERYVSREDTHPSLYDQFIHGKLPEEQVELKNKKQLSNILNKYVNHYDLRDDPTAAKDFPRKEEKIFKVPMSPEQEGMYKYLEGNIPFMTRLKIRRGLPLSKKESKDLNAFSSGVRQVSNTVSPFNRTGNHHLSPKLMKAVDELEKNIKADKNHRGLVYSNYLEAGLNEYSAELTKRGIKHTLYTGELKKSDKDEAVKNYNSGKVPNLLISSSGAEGLDLKGTKLIQILEPHFNKSKIDQVRGRGIRYKSHEHLPEEERVVKVQHFHSTFRPNMFGQENKNKAIDQYLHENSAHKEDLVTQVKHLLKSKDKNR